MHDYSNYILHLEKALQDVDNILAVMQPLRTKASNTSNSKHNQEAQVHERQEKKLAKFIMKLEEQASARGESGLAICLSKPFQRLLKYPLLFQVSLRGSNVSSD